MADFQTLIQRGPRGSQPAATAVPTGTLYFVTDEGVTERSNGTTWDAYSGSVANAEYYAGTSGASKTIDWDDGNTQLLQLTDNCTLTLSNPQSGGRYLLVLEQDGTGSRTVTWPSEVIWSAGTAPTLTTTINKADVVTLVWMPSLGASGNYIAAANLNYTPA